MSEGIWDEERTLWLGGAAEAARRLDDVCLLVLGQGGVLTRDEAIAALADTPPWHEITLADRALVETDELCVLAYRATARRQGMPAHRAICTTTWLRRDGDWRIVQHHRTPLTAQAAGAAPAGPPAATGRP